MPFPMRAGDGNRPYRSINQKFKLKQKHFEI